MKKRIVLSISLLLIGNLIVGQYHTNQTGFEYDTLAPETGNINAGIYELKKDYTISLPAFFNYQDSMPSKNATWQIRDIYKEDAEFYHNWASNLPIVDCDFIRIERGGILTIKKGYRWDGASNPVEKMGYHNYRSSFVHDAIYDLMRMGYLKSDKNHRLIKVNVPIFGWVNIDHHKKWSDGDYNRAMADMIHFFIAIQDQDSRGGAQDDFKVIRKYGAVNTYAKELLGSWKFHVSELAAYATDGKVELNWQSANEAGDQPYSLIELVIDNKITGYHVTRNDKVIATVGADATSYTDTDVNNNGDAYIYQVIPHSKNLYKFDWSNKKYAVPLKGAGTALKLDGEDDYVEANITSNDLCYHTNLNDLGELSMEAWVKPENQTGKAAILAFNPNYSNNYNILMYDGDKQQFCYYDNKTSYVYGTSIQPVNKWYHVALTIEYKDVYYDGPTPINVRKGNLYINGVKQVSFKPTIFPKHGARFSIGQEWDSNPSNFFKGYIDEVRIWKDIRTQNELKANMYCPLRGDENDLVGLWHFNEPASTNELCAHDATVHDNTGTLHGYQKTENPFVSSEALAPQSYVTGDGWITSPAGAIAEKPDAGGRAKFRFAFKYNQTADTLNGNMTFQMSRPDLFFRGTSYSKMFIDHDKAVVRGSGTVDRQPGYGFMLSVIDGDLTDNNEGDKFRIKIWDETDNTIIYDNEMGISEELRSVSGLNSGSVIIHDQNVENPIRYVNIPATTIPSGATREEPTENVDQGRNEVLRDNSSQNRPGEVSLDEANENRHNGAQDKNIELNNIRIQSFPNPFSSSTEITYSNPNNERVEIAIFDMSGRKVKVLRDNSMNNGHGTIIWDGTNERNTLANNGIYYCRIQVGNQYNTIKLMLQK